MSGTASTSRGGQTAAERLGIGNGMLVLELGYDEDVDDGIRAELEDGCGAELVDGEDGTDEVVDAVLLWWRDGDGDLVDALVDALGPLAEQGVVWVLTPKAGRNGHVEPSDITEAAPTAGLAQTSSVNAGLNWTGYRLVSPKAARGRR